MRNKKYFGKEVAAMSGKTLFEKLGVKYIEKDGIFYPLITYGRSIHIDTEVWCGLENYMIRQQK